MLKKIKKLPSIIKRDGLWYTIKRTVAWLIGNSPLSQWCSFHYYQSTRLAFTPSLLTYRIFADRTTRRNDIIVLEKHVLPGQVVIDVGANVGSFTIAAAALTGATGKVLSFEPSPKFADIIRRNIKLNSFSDFVTVHQVALGASRGTALLNEAVADDTTNFVAKTGTPVPLAPIDSFTKDFSVIDFIKIDAEGSELEILKGGHETMLKTKVLLIELCVKTLRRSGVNVPELHTLLCTYFTLHHKDDGAPFVFDPNVIYSTDLIGYSKNFK